jgi:hypothetical protein
VNADPNYGAAWFHCRAQPHDVPSTVLKSAIDKLVHELTATQAIYTRAVFHFIRRCLRGRSGLLPRTRSFGSEDGQLGSPPRPKSAPLSGRKPASGDAESSRVSRSMNFAAGALNDQSNSSFLGAALDTSTISHPASSSVALGAHSRSPSRDGADMHEQSAQLTRETELLEDIAAVDKNLHDWPRLHQVHLLRFVDIGNGAIYCCTDFTTGMIEMNRDMYNPNLSAEGKRKILFGSDQIVS